MENFQSQIRNIYLRWYEELYICHIQESDYFIIIQTKFLQTYLWRLKKKSHIKNNLCFMGPCSYLLSYVPRIFHSTLYF